MSKWVFEDTVHEFEIDIEDSGHAAIIHVEGIPEGSQLFVRIQSWSDDVKTDSSMSNNLRDNGFVSNHPELASLVGKKIRVTVETIN